MPFHFLLLLPRTLFHGQSFSNYFVTLREKPQAQDGRVEGRGMSFLLEMAPVHEHLTATQSFSPTITAHPDHFGFMCFYWPSPYFTLSISAALKVQSAMPKDYKATFLILLWGWVNFFIFLANAWSPASQQNNHRYHHSVHCTYSGLNILVYNCSLTFLFVILQSLLVVKVVCCLFSKYNNTSCFLCF